jgi:formate dehydrogenase (NADP+) alpha subunit
MQNINITINNIEISVKSETTVLEAARQAGIYIPSLCYSPDLAPYGACRLCLVEIKGMKGLQASCTTPVSEGMVVNTETEIVNRVRKTILELLLSDHPMDCLTCKNNLNCELQKAAAYLGVDQIRFRGISDKFEIDDSNPFFEIDRNKCILCGRCTRTCQEITCVNAIDMINRGYDMKVAAFNDANIFESVCQSCGECAAHCPTGALSHKYTAVPLREVVTTCPYCGVGCSMILGTRGNKIVSVRGNPDGPANNGQLCVKGRYGIIDFVHSEERLKKPLIRKNGVLIESGWDEAIDLIASKLSEYKQDEMAVIPSSRTTNEDCYVAQKFGRAVLGTNNIDNCARVCHAPTVAGLAISFGSGAMTNSIADLKYAKCMLVIGSNTTEAHPVISFKVKQAVRNGTKLIVINPRKIDLVNYADIWLQLKPGTNVALVMGLIHVIFNNNLEDHEFINNRCENYSEFKESLPYYTPERVESITGVPSSLIIDTAKMYASCKPSSILYTLGVTEHTNGTDGVMALANLAMITGNIGKPGSGVNPLRGQNNVQGACDMGALPNVFTGYQPVNSVEVVRKFSKAWDTELNDKPGLTLTEIYDSAFKNDIKAVYIIGEDPVLSEPDMNHTIKALSNLDFLIVQEIFLSETAKLADVVLPACSFAETDGTYINTERRFQRIRKAVDPPGQAKPDWEIVCMIARKFGKKGFNYTHPSQIMDEIAALTPAFNGISYDRLESGGIQWPCGCSDDPGTAILHCDTFTRGKGKLMPLRYRTSAELPDKEYPFLLTTGRSLFHYHTGTMTRKVNGLNKFKGEEFIEINPVDAKKLNIVDGEYVKISSRRGSIQVRVKVTGRNPEGVVYMTFHFKESPANALTSTALDPISKTPELKVCAVRIDKNV